MSTPTNWVALPGSERDPLPGARAGEAADPAERILVTVVVRRKATARDAGADRLPFTHLRREDFAALYGGQPEDMAAVASFARSNDLTVVESHPARRSIILSGTVAAFSAAFGVELSRYDHAAEAIAGGPGRYTSRLNSLRSSLVYSAWTIVRRLSLTSSSPQKASRGSASPSPLRR